MRLIEIAKNNFFSATSLLLHFVLLGVSFFWTCWLFWKEHKLPIEDQSFWPFLFVGVIVLILLEIFLVLIPGLNVDFNED